MGIPVYNDLLLQPDPWRFTGSSPSDPIELERLQHLLDRLNPRDADIVELTLKGIPQHVMGRLFGCSQPSIGYRFHKAIRQMHNLARFREYSEVERWEIFTSFDKYYLDYLQTRRNGTYARLKPMSPILEGYWVHRSQTKLDKLGLTPQETCGDVYKRFQGWAKTNCPEFARAFSARVDTGQRYVSRNETKRFVLD